jgi:hypothetical protein
MSRKSEDTEERRRLIRAWDLWAAQNVPADRKATGNDGFIFFQALERERSDLLEFKSKADKWQTVHGWLLRQRKVSD